MTEDGPITVTFAMIIAEDFYSVKQRSYFSYNIQAAKRLLLLGISNA